MIQLTRRRSEIPTKYQREKLDALRVKLVEAFYDHEGDIPFNQSKSKLQQWKEAKPALVRESSGKCAYCESPTSTVAYGDVEHFRPKDTYWWLAYSFDNFTFSCQLCNQRFKGANFPIEGPTLEPPVELPEERPSDEVLQELASALFPDPADDHAAELRRLFGAEKAHLPHPYLDSPETLFAWEVDDINHEVTLVARGGGVKAKRATEAAIACLGLNREDLRRQRYAQYDLVHTHCLVLQAAEKEPVRKLTLEVLERAAAAPAPYAGMTRHFLREWGVLE